MQKNCYSKKRPHAGTIKTVCIVLFLMGIIPVSAAESIKVTVQAGATHSFLGLGASHTTWNTVPINEDVSVAVLDSMTNMIYGRDEGDFRVLRIWCRSDTNTGRYWNFNPARMNRIYQPLLESIEKVQDSLIILFGAWGPSNGYVMDNLEEYADTMTNWIRELKETYSINVQATGIFNEPNNHIKNVIAGGMTTLVKLFRSKLDAKGLQDVLIIAPECSNVLTYNPRGDEDGDTAGSHIAMTDSLISDKDALGDLDGFGFHSYKYSMTKGYRDKIRPYTLPPYNKTVWQTESSADAGYSADFPDSQSSNASFTSSLFLNDVNLGTNYWMFYTGFGIQGATWSHSRQHLIDYNTAASLIYPYMKYYYLRQLSKTAFSVGAKVRLCSSDLGTNSKSEYMVVTYGYRPPVNAGACVNPDGTWGLAAVNTTGSVYAPDAGTSTDTVPSTWDVTFHVEELVNKGNVDFNVYRSNERSNHIQDGKVTMVNGEVTVTVESNVLVTLRAVTATEIVPVRQDNVSRDKLQIRFVDMGRISGPSKMKFEISSTGLDSKASIELEIYNTSGKLIKSFAVGKEINSNRTVFWDRKDEGGGSISSGLYFARIFIGNKVLCYPFLVK